MANDGITFEQVIVSLISGGVVSLFIFYWQRRLIVKQIRLDLFMRPLVQEVYVPLAKEYDKSLSAGPDAGIWSIDYASIESIIGQNLFLIKFAPDNVSRGIRAIYSISQSIRPGSDTEEKTKKLYKELSNVYGQIAESLDEYAK